MDCLQKRVMDFYDAEAAQYDSGVKYVQYFAPEWIKRHAQVLGGRQECRVLDLGCGTGINVATLNGQRSGVCAEGVDLSTKMLEQARLSGRYEKLYAHDLHNELPEIISETFDLVIAFGFLEFLSDMRVCLSECRRVLKADGILWATFRRFEYSDEASPPRTVSIEGLNITGYSAAEILNQMSHLNMRITSLEAVVAYVTRTGFGCPYYVVQVQKM